MRKSQPGNSIYLEIGIWYDEARCCFPDYLTTDFPDYFG